MGASIFFTASMIRGFRSARSRGRVLCVLWTKCMLHSNHRLTVWYSNTQNDFSPRAAIFSIHKLTSPSGRNVNYNETKLTGGDWSCSFYLYRFPKYVSYGFPIINFCIPRVHYETPCILFCIYQISEALWPLFLWTQQAFGSWGACLVIRGRMTSYVHFHYRENFALRWQCYWSFKLGYK